MNLMRGKSTIFNLILLLLVAYGGFALVKHLGAGFEARSIAAAVKDRISLERGQDFTPAKGEELIRQILERRGVIVDDNDDGDVEMTIDSKRQVIEYYFRYGMDVDFLFFTQRRIFEVEDEIPSYS